MIAPGIRLPIKVGIPLVEPIAASALKATKLAPCTTGSFIPIPVWIMVAIPQVKKHI